MSEIVNAAALDQQQTTRLEQFAHCIETYEHIAHVVQHAREQDKIKATRHDVFANSKSRLQYGADGVRAEDPSEGRTLGQVLRNLIHGVNDFCPAVRHQKRQSACKASNIGHAHSVETSGPPFPFVEAPCYLEVAVAK